MFVENSVLWTTLDVDVVEPNMTMACREHSSRRRCLWLLTTILYIVHVLRCKALGICVSVCVCFACVFPWRSFSRTFAASSVLVGMTAMVWSMVYMVENICPEQCADTFQEWGCLYCD